MWVDVVIAGGGPVGCATAILLARAGRSVLIVERGTYERRLPGERLTPDVIPALSMLDVTVETNESPGIVSLWDGPEPVVKPAFIHPLGGGHTVARLALDRAFAVAATRAGATVRAGARVRSISKDDGGWDVDIEGQEGPFHVRAGFLIDASGRAAAVARRLGSSVRRVDSLVACLTWLPVAPEVADRFCPLHVEAIEGGWVYAVAVENRSVAVGACSHRGLRHIDRRVALQDAIARSELLSGQFPTAGSAPRVFPASPALTCPPAGPGWIAIGDAAAQMDPISGSGLRQGLETAFRGAELAMLDSADRDAITPYYVEAIHQKHDDHRRIRRDVYADAADRLGESFFARLDRYVSPGLSFTR